MILAGQNVKPGSLEVDGVDSRDMPDFCDAYFSYAEFDDGTPLTDQQLDELTTQYADVVNIMAYDNLVGMCEDAGDDR